MAQESGTILPRKALIPFMETLEDLRQRILSCRKAYRQNRQALADIALSLECLSLSLSTIPDEVFLLYAEVLNDDGLGKIPHSSNFIQSLFNDFEKLSALQQKRLLDIFVQQAYRYHSRVLQFSVGDIIARKYPFSTAVHTFKTMWETGKPPAKNIAHFGVNVLSLTLPGEGAERDALRELGNVMKMGTPS